MPQNRRISKRSVAITRNQQQQRVAILGENAFSEVASKKYPCPFAEFAWASRAQSVPWKDIAGNAMHAQLLVAIMGYFLASVVPFSNSFSFSLCQFRRGHTGDVDSQEVDQDAFDDRDQRQTPALTAPEPEVPEAHAVETVHPQSSEPKLPQPDSSDDLHDDSRRGKRLRLV